LTWRNGDCWDGEQPFCCKKSEDWQHCSWHGKPGSCFDDHCDTGHQVELANSYEGEGDDCGWNDRTRVFCCDPPADQAPFLPVPLDYLFPNPPPADSAKAEFKLKTDPTFGGAVTTPFANDPQDAAFGFIVLTSPDTIQVSLDKRDGSHWEVFDCFDATSEEEHTVRMLCTDDSHSSNCDKIHLGKGVPGTILEMPEGCGPGKYAVAVQLETSENQDLPQHLRKRDLPSSPIVYDLKFDYDFARVPRDLGTTQMRIDFANEDGYWNKVVDKAASKKRKRSLGDYSGNKKRFLEEAWREDKHHSGLSHEELHKRWFGSDVITWLKGLINGVKGGPNVHHSYVEDFTAILLRESWTCSSGIVTASAQLDVVANTHVAVNTNFGLTIIATLSSPIDLSNSYLYFRNDGEITAKFTLDALASVNFDTGDMVLLSADKFGAAFTVPGIVTIGPNFKLVAQVEGGITLSGHIVSEVNIAKWNVQQTFPDVSADWDPQASSNIDPSGTQDMTPKEKPLFDASVAANGYLTTHLKPTITFGIEFNKNFIPVDPATVNLVADGFVTAYANAAASTSGGASFCYGVDAGAQLYASVSVPPVFGWKLPQSRFQIGPQLDFQIVEETCPIKPSRREIAGNDSTTAEDAWTQSGLAVPELESGTKVRSLQARAQIYGPILHIPSDLLKCPGEQPGGSSTANSTICEFCTTAPVGRRSLGKRTDPSCLLREPGRPDEPSCLISGGASKRSQFKAFFADLVKPAHSRRNSFEKRDRKKIGWATTLGGIFPLGPSPLELDAGPYPPCTEAQTVGGIPKYFTFDAPGVGCSGVVKEQTLATVNSLKPVPKFESK
jgi:chitinase